jgi:hypothetical protein
MTLSPEKREALAEWLIDHYLDAMSYRDLAQFFSDVQLDYIRSYSDAELIGEIEDNTTAEEYAELVGK